jgi:predicted O-linked N-acetylglucosamine transferase (SPINDLY family)
MMAAEEISDPQHLSLSRKFRADAATLAAQAEQFRRTQIAELHSQLKSGQPKPGTYIELARLHLRLRQFGAAITVLEEALAVCEPDEHLHREAVFVLQQANRLEAALPLARCAKHLFPDAPYFELWEVLMLPPLYTREADIESHRARFSTALDDLAAGLNLATPQDRRRALRAISGHVNFYLGYQGRNDRELQERYARLVHRIMAANYPQWVHPLPMRAVPPGSRIRVGYVTAHFRDHSVSKLFLGWLAEHNRRDFELFAYHNGHSVDAVTDKVQHVSEHFRHVPGDFEQLCRAIVADSLDVAVFLDVRHRRMAMMSTLRLAPLQCVAWAHPITSGSPTIDYYLSGDLMEPEDGQDHYSERLIRLPGIGVCYSKPVIPRALLGKGRSDFGLAEDRIVFLCCQSSFKYLPQHDDLFARIAKRLPASQFVFLALNDLIAGQFQDRLQCAFSAEGLDASDYCVILPQQTTFDYWNLNLISDVFLDSLEWSGGVTALEAIACGLPIVTLPGPFMRGRHSYGILMQLGVTETIARDKASYVDVAVRLGTDRQWRAQILERMQAGHTRLYADTACVRGLEEFFRSAVRERRGEGLARSGSSRK